ncbi:phosphoesterase [Aureimonas sp. AU12]|uniref:phosphoesterase n=1 Tax=Aureimonas sp. AU12 TaxID=1638161 RepID=UPI000AF2ED68|nr:phosphoesterase [Aureimonas sp. AU12]
MLGRQNPSSFLQAIHQQGDRPLLVCHNDADGLSAGVVLAKTLRQAKLSPVIRIIGKGDNAYSDAFRSEVEAYQSRQGVTGLILTDVGTSTGPVTEIMPTIIVDHHVPTGIPEHATVISGIDDNPIPTSSLLAYRCALTVFDAEALLWLAALGIIGDMAEKDGFPEMEEARAYGITALRKAASLVNAPRRSSSGDASPAFALLERATGPKQVLSGEFEETAVLLAARDEVRAEVEKARKAAPKIVGPVAIVPIDSACQIHPLIAQTWSGRLKAPIVMAANFGYRPGWVHFAARTGQDADIPAFLAGVRPPGANEQYGKGHRLASGGALRVADWNIFVRTLGFGPELETA